MSEHKSPKRIVIVGSTGSGKTTLGQNLGQRLGLVHIELDSIFWGPNWTPIEETDFIAQTKSQLSADGWVVDGNYRAVRDMVWEQADTVVWLNYPLPTIFKQLFKRTYKRVRNKEVLWNNNVETFREQFLSAESLFIYAIKHRLKSHQYRTRFQDPKFAHLNKIELRSPKQMRHWFSSLPEITASQNDQSHPHLP